MHEGVNVTSLAVVAVCFVVWGALSSRLPRWNISAPIAFVAAGMLLSAGSDPVLSLGIGTEHVLLVTEITLAVVLFGDAAGVPMRALRLDAGLPARLLLIGLPLTMAAGTLAAHLLLPGLSWWMCALIGAAVAPTDAALGAAIVEDERIPGRIRRVLNVESGLNDGLATPFVSFFLIAAVTGEALGHLGPRDALVQLAIGVGIGVACGCVGGFGLGAARRRGLLDDAFLPLAILALAVLAYAATVSVDGNGFVAAFVGGLAYGASRRRDLPQHALEFTKEQGEALSLVVWLLFGCLVLHPLENAGWNELGFAVLALTVVRMVPVAISVIGTGLDRATVGVIGWFGPRGLASVVFALLADEALPRADADRVLATVGLTVLLSVVLHGVSASPIARRYGADHADPSPAADPAPAGEPA